jgi:hypothetical protein
MLAREEKVCLGSDCKFKETILNVKDKKGKITTSQSPISPFQDLKKRKKELVDYILLGIIFFLGSEL